MRLNRLSPSSDSGPRSAEARLQGNFRSEVYKLLLAGAVTLGVSACGGENPNNPDGGAGTGGNGGTGGTTEGGGGSGGGGANPCEGLVFEGLAGEEVSPGETMAVTVDLGESHPDKAYNGLRMEINGDVLTKPGLAGLMKKTDVTANGDYQLVEMKGFRTLVIDKENNYRLNESGNCELNTLEVNEDVMNDINKRPVVTLPPGLWLSAFRVQEGKGVLEDFELTAEGTRSRISELSGEGYFPANSKPVVVSKITRDQEGHIVVDLAGTTDEGDGNDMVLEKLGVMASDGLVFAKMPDGTYRSTNPSSLGSFDLFVSGLAEGMADDTTEVNAVVSCEGIDCNGHGTCAEGTCACDAGFNNDDTDPTDDCDSCDTGYENYPICSEINNFPVINSLLANPNPCDTYDSTTLSFNITDLDNDNVNWTLTMDDIPGGVDHLSNPSNGNCNGLTCSGILPSGGGNVTLTYNTGSFGNPTMTLDVDDGKGGTDQDQEVITVQ